MPWSRVPTRRGRPLLLGNLRDISRNSQSDMSRNAGPGKAPRRTKSPRCPRLPRDPDLRAGRWPAPAPGLGIRGAAACASAGLSGTELPRDLGDIVGYPADGPRRRISGLAVLAWARQAGSPVARLRRPGGPCQSFRRRPIDGRREPALFDDVGVHAFQGLGQRPTRPGGSPSKNRRRTISTCPGAASSRACRPRSVSVTSVTRLSRRTSRTSPGPWRSSAARDGTPGFAPSRSGRRAP